METRTIHVERMNDESSASLVRQALQEVWGIRSVNDVSLARKEVTIMYDEKASSFGDFLEALEERGFEPRGGDSPV